MKIADRYLVGEIVGPFSLAVVGFVIIGIADIVFVLVDRLVSQQIPVLAILQLILYQIPSVLVIFFPMAALFAVMLVLIRLAKDNELTIFRAQGINMFRLFLPIVCSACLFSLFSYVNNEHIVPWTNRQSQSLIRQAALKNPLPAVKDQVFFKDQENRVFYGEHLSADQKTLEKVLIIERTQAFPRVIIARKAVLNGRIWQLTDGIIHNYDANGHVAQEATFKTMTIRQPMDMLQLMAHRRTPKEMSRQELHRKIAILKKSGFSVSDLAIEYHLKAAMPWACLIFALTGIALCVSLVKTAKDWWGVVAASIIAALSAGFFITLMAVFRALGRGGFLPPALAAWGANIIFGILAGGIILRKTNR